jgi:hypothetical protein
VPRQGLVDGIVDNFVDQVVQSSLAGAPDIHAGSLAYCLKTFQDLDIAGVVRHTQPLPPEFIPDL